MNVRELGIQAQEHVVAEMAENDGKVPTIDLVDPATGKAAVIGEMLGTDDGAAEFVEKVTYDAYSGREAVPLLYRTIYTTKTDANFPRTMTAEEFGPVQVVFLKKYEGGEIKFGAMGSGPTKTVSFETWGAGMEYDEDIVEYNQTWRVGDIGQAFGEAYNKMLNHLHLSPIVSGTYTKTGSSLADQHAKQVDAEDSAAQSISFDTDIETTLKNALQVLPKGSILLINSFDQFKLEQALANDMYSDNSAGPVKQRLSLSNAVVYDGTEVVVGGKTYTYSGVPAGTAFLIAPQKRNFVEYIKHDLRVDTGDGDLSRLILAQVVGRTRRAVLAGLSGEFGCVKVALTSS